MATMAGYWLKTQLLSKKVDIRATVAICAFVSAVLGATDSLFALGSTPDIALGTSVLYLVPGIPLLNSFSDMLYRYYICSMSRFSMRCNHRMPVDRVVCRNVHDERRNVLNENIEGISN